MLNKNSTHFLIFRRSEMNVYSYTQIKKEVIILYQDQNKELRSPLFKLQKGMLYQTE